MSQSRMESILSGTYTGRPLSRIEALLMSGSGGSSGGGGGSTPIPDTEHDFTDADMDDIFSAISTDNN